jgi:hypothetical protein
MNYLVKVDRHGLIRKTQTVSYVSYVSDGKVLNAILWLNPGFDERHKYLKSKNRLKNRALAFSTFDECTNKVINGQTNTVLYQREVYVNVYSN